MNVKELMIGDIIYIDNIPRIVASITKHKVGYHKTEGESRLYYARASQCLPVPLTRDMLEREGWKQSHPSYPFYKEGVPFDIVLGKRELYLTRDGEAILSLMFIHELQQSYRSVGLAFLADVVVVADIQR